MTSNTYAGAHPFEDMWKNAPWYTEGPDPSNRYDGLNLRIRRALSWFDRATVAQSEPDEDMEFLLYWIAFNALYGQLVPPSLPREDLKLILHYLKAVVKLDSRESLKASILSDYQLSIEELANNQYIYYRYWHFRSGDSDCADWKSRFNADQRSVNTALHHKEILTVLRIVFSRLYTLRNQLFHGSATWGGHVNRSQVMNGAAIMRCVVPRCIIVMIQHPDEPWGTPSYPVVSPP